jgi:hypothetical protein
MEVLHGICEETGGANALFLRAGRGLANPDSGSTPGIAQGETSEHINHATIDRQRLGSSQSSG